MVVFNLCFFTLWILWMFQKQSGERHPHQFRSSVLIYPNLSPEASAEGESFRSDVLCHFSAPPRPVVCSERHYQQYVSNLFIMWIISIFGRVMFHIRRDEAQKISAKSNCLQQLLRQKATLSTMFPICLLCIFDRVCFTYTRVSYQFDH